jgi:hypothetical protein
MSFWLMVGLAMVLLVYWSPTMVAASRGLPLRRIAWLNFFFGIWSFIAVASATRRTRNTPLPPSDYRDRY